MRRWDYLGSVLVLAIVAAAGTFFAVSSYPMWDDAYVDLMALDQGADRLAESATDRPLAAAICAWLVVEPSQFYLKAATMHWLVCLGMGLFTLYLARQLFPERPTLALSTACLATTTFLCRTQIVLAIHPNTPGLSSISSFLAVALLSATVLQRLPAWNVALRWIAAAALIVAGGLVSEYFIAGTLAGIGWILFLGMGLETPARKRSYQTALALTLLMVAVYVVYHQTTSTETRAEVRPEQFLSQGLAWRAKVTIPVWASAVYTGCLGATFERLGSLRLQTFVDMAAIALGLILAGMVQVFAGKRTNASDTPTDHTVELRLILGLVVAVALGLLPLVVMGRRPDLTTFGARFWAPVVPYALCATAGIFASLLRSKRLWVLSPVLALLAGWALVSDGVQARRELRRVSSWGPEVRQLMSDDGMCVAIFENAWQPGDPIPNDYELTARLARTWSREERERFWAFPNFYWTTRKDASSGIEIDHQLLSPEIHRTTRSLVRQGPIRRILWVFVPLEGELQIRAVDVPPTDKP